MRPSTFALRHPAAAALLEYATNGCPVDCGTNWTLPQLEAAVQQGAHPSALTPEATAYCRNEAFERVNEGMATKVLWDDIKHNPPPNLKISPIAAIPHKSRQFRVILNLAYELKFGTTKLKSVNDATDKTLAPQHSMHELGNVIPRIILAMANADPDLPLLFSKVDLKDGYWRMAVHPDDAWNFAYVLPASTPTSPPELIIPQAIQMGWSESPAFFCAATETARDIANTMFEENIPLPPHPQEDKIFANTDWSAVPSQHNDPDPNILYLLESYIDDFIKMIQCTDPSQLVRLTRAVLHAIYSIFPPPEVTNSNMGPPISNKKLDEEGAWEVRKEVLGWLLDGIARTIQLPPNKATKLLNELRHLKRQKFASVKDLQKLQGKLQFTSIGIPLGKPLLSDMDNVITNAERKGFHHVKINEKLKVYITNWKALIYLMQSRPSHVRELTHRPSAAYRGFVDASKWGVGGVWFGGDNPLPPIV